MRPKHVKELIRLVPQSPLPQCSDQFVGDLKGILVFEVSDYYPLLENISIDDMVSKRNMERDNWAYDSYRVTFSKHFIEQVQKHYPEELI